MHEQVRNAGLKGIPFRVYSHELVYFRGSGGEEILSALG